MTSYVEKIVPQSDRMGLEHAPLSMYIVCTMIREVIKSPRTGSAKLISLPSNLCHWMTA